MRVIVLLCLIPVVCARRVRTVSGRRGDPSMTSLMTSRSKIHEDESILDVFDEGEIGYPEDRLDYEVVFEHGDDIVLMVYDDDDGEEDGETRVLETVIQYLDEPGLWGLDRMDAGNCLPYDSSYTYEQYIDKISTVYVLDTGVNENVDYVDRLVGGINLVTTDGGADDYNDEHGHGTMVSGLIAGHTYGTCKDNCNIYAVKVLSADGYGSFSTAARGVYHAVQHALDTGNKFPIINLSLGGGISSVMNNAVRFAVERGVLVVVAAGNDEMNACAFSPAGSSYAVTVGASARDDTLAYFSNHGSCVDVYAPGIDLKTTLDYESWSRFSGTSASTPLVAGILAKLWMSTGERPTSSSVTEYTSSDTPVPVLTVSPGGGGVMSYPDDMVDVGSCFQFTAEFLSKTRRYPGMEVKLFDVGGNCTDHSGDFMHMDIGYSRLLVSTPVSSRHYIRYGKYLRGENRYKGRPFEVKIKQVPGMIELLLDGVLMDRVVSAGNFTGVTINSRDRVVMDFTEPIICSCN